MTIRLLGPDSRMTADCIVIGLPEKGSAKDLPIWKSLVGPHHGYLANYIQRNLTGAEGEADVVTLPGRKLTRVMVIGLGPKKQWNLRKLRLRMRQVVRTAHQHKIQELGILLDHFLSPAFDSKLQAQEISENLLMADYQFIRYRKPPKAGFSKVKKIELWSSQRNRMKEMKAGTWDGQITGAWVNAVRELCNTPAGEMTPSVLADEASILARESGVSCQILNESDLKRLGMGGILGVSRGSNERPKFIVLKYEGRKNTAPVVLVGKGVTFDSGGLNLKPEKAMTGMHLDMSGAAAVIGAVCAAGELKLPVSVIALAPAAENMPSGSGYRPGDILKTMSGKTIEVLNTDAEGRILLADALHYAKQYHPRLVVDVATLTGACMVALGYRASGLFTTDNALAELFARLGEDSGDYVWRLPLWEEYGTEIKGTFGDVMNVGKYTGMGSAITAAHFLKVFADGYPWVHLDIAPTMEPPEDAFLYKGSAGAAVRLLVALLSHYSH